jgi:hypothetical protein
MRSKLSGPWWFIVSHTSVELGLTEREDECEMSEKNARSMGSFKHRMIVIKYCWHKKKLTLIKKCHSFESWLLLIKVIMNLQLSLMFFISVILAIAVEKKSTKTVCLLLVTLLQSWSPKVKMLLPEEVPKFLNPEEDFSAYTVKTKSCGASTAITWENRTPALEYTI